MIAQGGNIQMYVYKIDGNIYKIFEVLRKDEG